MPVTDWVRTSGHLSSMQGFHAPTKSCRHVQKIDLHAFCTSHSIVETLLLIQDDVALTLSGAIWWGQEVQHSAVCHRRELMDVASAGRVQHSRRVAFLQCHMYAYY